MPDEKKNVPDEARVIDCDAQAEAKRPAIRLGGKVFTLPFVTVGMIEAHDKIERNAEEDPSGLRTMIKRLSILLNAGEKEFEGCDVRAISMAWTAANNYIYGVEEEDPTPS